MLLFNLKKIKNQNFYQNHRRYMKSVSSSQLKGNILEEEDAKSSCAPVVYNKDITFAKTGVGSLTPLDPDAVAHPCGIAARSFFNDTYTFYKGRTQIPINEKGIAWEADVQHR